MTIARDVSLLATARSSRMHRFIAMAAVLAGVLVAGLLAVVPAHATFPGKNGKIAYSFLPGPTNFGSDNFEIVTIVPGSPLMPLPPQNPRKDNWPDWSPDGKEIVWWHQGPAGNVDIYKMNADGTGQTNLTSENPSFDANAAWSPDKTEIVLDSDYQTDTGSIEIQVMDAAGENFRQLTHEPEFDDNFGQFSPDGERIVWNRFDFASDVSAIYTMDADDGGDVEQVTPDELNAGLPDWSPDGERIVFTDNFCNSCPAQTDLWVIDADGGNLERLTNTPTETEFRPGFSPDGKMITFTSIPLTDEAPNASLPADIYVMTAKGKSRTNITNSPTFQDRASDWGPQPEKDKGEHGQDD
jgi:TolB protein